MVDGQVAGYATVYDTPHNFTWATVTRPSALGPPGSLELTERACAAKVRGAGHMAPLFQPLRVFGLFSRFLSSESP